MACRLHQSRVVRLYQVHKLCSYKTHCHMTCALKPFFAFLHGDCKAMSNAKWYFSLVTILLEHLSCFFNLRLCMVSIHGNMFIICSIHNYTSKYCLRQFHIFKWNRLQTFLLCKTACMKTTSGCTVIGNAYRRNCRNRIKQFVNL